MELNEDEPMLLIIRMPAPVLPETLETPDLTLQGENEAEEDKEASEPLSGRTYGKLDVLQSSMYRRIKGKKVGFTSTGRNDGVGAQALGKITTRIMSIALNQRYAHSAFQILEHYDDNMKQMEYCKVWEDLLQIGNGFEKTSQYPLVFGGGCDNNTLHFVLSHNFQEGHLYILRDCHQFTEHYRDELVYEWKETIEALRACYHATALIQEIPVAHDPIRVAVHIRRGDATESRRLLDNDYYLSVMRSMEEKCSTKKFFFEIVSEGTKEDYKVFEDTFDGRIRLHISPPSTNLRTNKTPVVTARGFVAGRNVPRNQHLLQRRRLPPARAPKQTPADDEELPPTTEQAFRILVAADVLILSRSSFSYLASLYSRGVKLHPPDMWWSIPKWCENWDRWFPYDQNISFFETLEKL